MSNELVGGLISNVSSYLQASKSEHAKPKLIGARMIFQLECKESVECYCTEMHVASMGSLLVGCCTHMVVRRQVTCESEIPKRSRAS